MVLQNAVSFDTNKLKTSIDIWLFTIETWLENDKRNVII